jgi:hypothetical protein
MNKIITIRPLPVAPGSVTITDTINGHVVTRTVTNGGGTSTEVPVTFTYAINDHVVIRSSTNGDAGSTTISGSSCSTVAPAGLVVIADNIDGTSVTGVVTSGDGNITEDDPDLEMLSQYYDIAIPHPTRPWNLSDT